MPKFDDWFVIGMAVLVPLCIIMGIAAFGPSASTIKGWFTRGH